VSFTSCLRGSRLTLLPCFFLLWITDMDQCFTRVTTHALGVARPQMLSTAYDGMVEFIVASPCLDRALITVFAHDSPVNRCGQVTFQRRLLRPQRRFSSKLFDVVLLLVLLNGAFSTED
jgi:hypothetical protein